MSDPCSPFVALSRFVVANDKADAVDTAFKNRPHQVDSAKGFLRMEVLRGGDDGKEFVLLTWWTDEESYQVWYRGHTYQDAHLGMPKGLRLVKGSMSVSTYASIAQ